MKDDGLLTRLDFAENIITETAGRFGRLVEDRLLRVGLDLLAELRRNVLATGSEASAGSSREEKELRARTRCPTW